MSLHKVSLCVCGLFFLLMERGKRKAECGPPNSDVDKYRQLRTGLFFGSFVSIWNHHESSFTCMIDSYLYVSQCVGQSDPPRFNYQYISINIYVVILNTDKAINIQPVKVPQLAITPSRYRCRHHYHRFSFSPYLSQPLWPLQRRSHVLKRQGHNCLHY